MGDQSASPPLFLMGLQELSSGLVRILNLSFDGGTENATPLFLMDLQELRSGLVRILDSSFDGGAENVTK